MKYIYGLVLAIFLFSNISHAEEKKERFIQAALFTYENDSVYGPDDYYTNGGQFLFLTRETKNSDVNKFLSTIFRIKDKTSHNYSFGLGQKIYTPSDIDIAELIPDDRPYAGYLYLFLDKNIRHDSNKTDTFGISIGLTGPASLGETVQKNVHEWIGSPIPQGWDNQLDNEVLFMLSWMRSLELHETKPYAFDWNAIPKFYANLGTPFTGAAVGMEFRFGWNLDYDLLPNRISSTSQGMRRNIKSENHKDISYYLFAEAQGDVVLYNTFLDGNISSSGVDPDISKNIFCYSGAVGLTLRVYNVYVKYSTIYLSEEFKEQDKGQFIFSLTAGFLF